ncbi:hypothetical protein V8C42DRAFT_334810 [Trichoderma barbatum]
MKHNNLPQGKVYRILPHNQWDHAVANSLQIPTVVQQHMVIVVGKSERKLHWLKVATITKTISPDVNLDLYVPIAPSRKNRKTNMQLHFCDDPYGDAGLLPFLSYLRVDKVYEVPQHLLVQELSWGRHLELKQDSYDRLLRFIKKTRGFNL